MVGGTVSRGQKTAGKVGVLVKPLRPLRSLPPQQYGNQRILRARGGRTGSASPIPQTVLEQVRGQRVGLQVHPSSRTAFNHRAPCGVTLRLGGKENSPGNLRYKIVSFTSPQSWEPGTLEGTVGVLKEEIGSGLEIAISLRSPRDSVIRPPSLPTDFPAR